MVRLYDVRAFEGDRHPAHAELCKPCVLAVLRGRAQVELRGPRLLKDVTAIGAMERRV
jgi:hypothetical protein